MKKLVLIACLLLVFTPNYAQYEDIRLHARVDSSITMDFRPGKYIDTLGQYIFTINKDMTFSYKGVITVYDTINSITKEAIIPIANTQWVVNKQNPIYSKGDEWYFTFLVSESYRGAGIIIAPTEEDIAQNLAYEYKFTSMDFGTTWKIQISVIRLITEPNKK